MKRPQTSRRLRLEFLEDRRMLSTISGVLWDDLDGDGVRQAAEPGLPDRTVYLDANDNDRLDDGEVTTTTDAAGGYSLADLSAGDYTVRQVLPLGWAQTSPAGIERAEFVDVLARHDPTRAGRQLTFGPDGNLYLVSNGGVSRFDAATGEFIDFFVAPSSGVREIAFGSDGNLYLARTFSSVGPFVACQDSGWSVCIVRIDGTTGAFIDVFAEYNTSLQPESLAFGPDGDLFLADHDDLILRFDGVSGAFRGNFVPRNSADLYFGGLTFGPGGDMFVARAGFGDIQNAGTILRYNGSTGAYRGQFVSAGSGGLDSPTGITFGPDGHLYVIDEDEDVEGDEIRVLRYHGTTGAFMGVYVQNTNVPTSNRPGLTFDDRGNLYLLVNGEGIFRFQDPSADSPGELLDVFSPVELLAGLRDFAFGPDGNVYIVSAATATIERYNPVSGEYLGTFVPFRSGGLGAPRGIDFGPDGNLYVASPGNDQILRYDGDTGDFLGAFVTEGSGGLDHPVGIDFGPDGNLYVVSLNTNEVLRYDGTSGQFIDGFVFSRFSGLDRPLDLTFGPDGALYVSNQYIGEVLRYHGTAGKIIDVFATVPPAMESQPYGIEFGPDGHLYVGGWLGADNVLRFDGQSGALIDEFIPDGYGGLRRPSFVHFGPDGLLYVSGRSSGLHRYELIQNGRDVSLSTGQTRRNINFGSRQTGTGPVADLTGNGFVDFEDLTVLLAAWTGPGAAAAPPAAVRSDRIHAVQQDPMNRGLQQDPMNRGLQRGLMNRVTPTVRRGKPAAYGRHDPLRRLQAAAVDRALGDDDVFTRRSRRDQRSRLYEA